MKVLIIRGRDVHTCRLEQGLQMCGVDFKTITSYEDMSTEPCDVTLIDPSVTFDPSDKINSKYIAFFDSEDGPRDFYPDVAYEAMKDSIEFYAKMNWVDDDRGDGIKNIGFPLGVYMGLRDIANIPLPRFSKENAHPFFVGTGTFIGNYKPASYKIGTGYLSDIKADINSLVMHENEFLYNQRIDWLLSLKKHGIPYAGGIVFTDNNLSLQWQSECFGSGVAHLSTKRISKEDFFRNLFKFQIGLSPSGHDRMSWRVFDIMAAGSILFWTDNKEQQSMYMPQEYITVKDGESFGEKFLSLEQNFEDIYKASQKNRDIFSNLTPNIIWNDFIKQF